MSAKLKNLIIKKVDFVEQGANPDAYIKLFKSKSRDNSYDGILGWFGLAQNDVNGVQTVQGDVLYSDIIEGLGLVKGLGAAYDMSELRMAQDFNGFGGNSYDEAVPQMAEYISAGDISNNGIMEMSGMVQNDSFAGDNPYDEIMERSGLPEGNGTAGNNSCDRIMEELGLVYNGGDSYDYGMPLFCKADDAGSSYDYIMRELGLIKKRDDSVNSSHNGGSGENSLSVISDEIRTVCQALGESLISILNDDNSGGKKRGMTDSFAQFTDVVNQCVADWAEFAPAGIENVVF